MTKLTDKLSRAITALGSGTYSGNLGVLLTESRAALLRGEAARLRAEKLSSQDLAQAHRRFGERLADILRVKIEVEDLLPGERLMWCYVSDFYATPASRRGSDTGEATITIRRADVRISTPEYLDERPSWHRVEYSERYGCHYREPRDHHWTFPERWLWSDDWREEFRRRSLEVRLRMARHHRREAISRRDELTTKSVPEAECRVLDYALECENLVAEMTALGMDIPPDEDPADAAT